MDALVDKLEISFNRRVDRGDRHPLIWAIYETFKFEFLLGGICHLVSGLLMVFSPFTSRFLIAFATDAYIAKNKDIPGPNIGRGIGLAVGLCLMQVAQALCSSQFMFRGMMVGGQSRAVLIQLIFKKSIKLSARAKAGGKAIENSQIAQENDSSEEEKRKSGPKVTPDIAPGIAGDGTGWGNGKIVTLMSVDTDRIDKALGLFHMLWVSPVILILALILLLVNITYSALSGYALLVLGVPLLTYSIQSLIRRRRSINKVTDQRVSLTQEILQAVRFVKYFGWENSFLERLKELRNREIFAIQIVMSIRNAILSISMALPVFASMLAFITYSLTGHDMTPAPIFSSLALFNSLRMPLNMFPLVLGQVTDAYTAVCRIQEFFLAEEQGDDIKFDMALDNAIEMDRASFTWERVPLDDKKDAKMPKKGDAKKPLETPDISDSSNPTSGTLTPVVPFQLKDLTFTVGRNELLAVIGTVGSGKSSLLSALAGDMRKTNGSIAMGASRAFCPQYAWIQNATVKENITFGKEYDDAWYNQVVDACALRADLDMLPAGDRTEVGERGITVSGGQKQRLNIARAIYFNADIVLMDDPLSAVDAHVGRHIMDNAICGLLKDKCRILATHQLHVLGRCDRIILMNEGFIESIDTFENLMRDNKVFQRLMATTAQEEGDGENKGEEVDDDDEVDEESIKAKDKPAKKVKSLKTPAALMQQEERAVDSVGWAVWKAYVSAFGMILNFPLIILTLVLANVASIWTNLWLSYWISNKYNLTIGAYIGIYAALGFAQIFLMFAYSTILSISGTNASKTMLKRAMTRVLRAPMSFFDTTPLGRITNRFSKDIHTMDNDLTDAMRIFTLTITMIVSVIIMIMVFYPYVSSTHPLLFLRS